MNIHLVAFTQLGAATCLRLAVFLKENGHQALGFAKYPVPGLLPLAGSVHEFTKKAFATQEALIYVGAMGIAVRGLAPFIQSKDQDPAVVVVDEGGSFVIPVLSGHLGGANELAEELAGFLNCQAVITTATDLQNLFAVDVWAKKNDLWVENPDGIKYISAAILRGEQVGFRCDFPFAGELPDFLTLGQAQMGIYISGDLNKERDYSPWPQTLYLRPQEFVVGIGCRRNTRAEDLETFFLENLDKLQILPFQVKTIATIDLKKDEPAILNLCRKFKYQLHTYTAAELREIQGDFASSDFVQETIGVDNVCERGAFLAGNKGKIILPKTAKTGMTMAVVRRDWRCPF